MLTDSSIKAAMREAVAGAGRRVLPDPGAKGEGRLALVVRANASRVAAEWYALFWRSGARRMVKIGAYPSLTLADARAKFRADYAPAIQSGANPENPYARRQGDGAKSATVGELFEGYVGSLRRRGSESAHQVERMLIRRPDSMANELGAERAAKDVRPADVANALAKIFDRGSIAQADVMRAYTRAAFTWALKSENDYRQKGATTAWGISANPVDAIPRDTEASQPRSRFLSEDEFRELWRWLIDHRSHSVASDAIRLQLLTGQRMKELCRLRTAQYDKASGVLALGKTKNGRQHGIPLCRQAVELMASLRPNSLGVYFPNRSNRSRPMTHSAPQRMLHTFRADTGIEPFTMQDLRRTWKTLAGRAGVDKVWRDVYQNHTLPGSDVSSRVYDWHDYVPDMRSRVLPGWEAFVDRILGGE